MKCALEREVSAELIVGYAARTLDPDRDTAFERHIETCAQCCEAAALQKRVWAALDHALDETRKPRLSPDFDRRLFRRIERAENRAWWLWRALVPVSACTALAAAFLMRQPDAASIPQPTPQPTLQIDQVEHALDDMDLLNKLGAAI
jgi:anti-sigma factor RsiW